MLFQILCLSELSLLSDSLFVFKNTIFKVFLIIMKLRVVKLCKLTILKFGTTINYMNMRKLNSILEFIPTTWENKFLILETNKEQSFIF